MHRILVNMMSVAVLLSVAATSVATERELTVRPFNYENIPQIVVGPVDPTSTCMVGNLNEPAWIIRDFMLPQEEYKLVFRSQGTCANCIFGFDVDRIHVLLETREACTITMSMDVEGSVNLVPGCDGPGEEWCVTESYYVMLPDSGAYDIGIPINCPCLARRTHLLSLRIENFSCATGSRPSIITDGSPHLCTNWNNIGTGWYDLLAEWPDQWPGDLLFWADASCCEQPVPVEKSTWGAIKSLYTQ
jgi:hypothetical protein